MTGQARERACKPVPTPASITTAVDGYRWARDTVGAAGAAVYRLHGKAGAPDLYLKHGHGTLAGDVTDEMVRLRWLADHLPVPRLVQFVGTPDDAWLLMTAVAGETAYQQLCAGGGGEIVDALARFLRRLHAIPPVDCPFNADHRLRMAQARVRIDAGSVDLDDFDDARQGWSAERVWDAMQALLPLHSDLVVTHGDFSLDNLVMAGGEVVGMIDVGRAGLADRWQDLAILWNCLDDFDASLQARLLTAYGIAPDADKLTFHLLLDELF
ncbi:APH(3')-I family aminoglycoside O-phosphotransferase [Polymorphobacter fuscus]|uniref:Aminoglycoside 3'-phosphotransferase n=1 Tax=Sandarakinorhabdus fusca TaxID=1439888 RepID=A0A7C9GQU2_9SPHN|nr:APH(3')-I family aminoglycoside O-phosphotransferase [Polymorphobacter fuscus]KAB7645481.1 APH(3')-I family aminoglycoside O-phosphotransferase [Polymorphobacter fuscus]MQT17910.1 APH(3')-I family aminoglycoside O-phosphotransferase [Polymorphobacter fuscus]NJC08540.1 aminoglycoside 3'-phosphotransferase-1 [Polymorphobacter fuscus]